MYGPAHLPVSHFLCFRPSPPACPCLPRDLCTSSYLCQLDPPIILLSFSLWASYNVTSFGKHSSTAICLLSFLSQYSFSHQPIYFLYYITFCNSFTSLLTQNTFANVLDFKASEGRGFILITTWYSINGCRLKELMETGPEDVNQTQGLIVLLSLNSVSLIHMRAWKGRWWYLLQRSRKAKKLG